MTQVVLYIAASLDGYIARPDGGIDWLSVVDREGEDYGYQAFFDSVHALISGSKTYELAVSFGVWPYAGKTCFVFTRRDLKTDRGDVVFVDGEPEDIMVRIEAEGFEKVWLVGGGEMINSFLKQGLIDEFIISVIPVILGEGIPIFPPSFPQANLELVDSKPYDTSLLQMHYRLKTDA